MKDGIEDVDSMFKRFFPPKTAAETRPENKPIIYLICKNCGQQGAIIDTPKNIWCPNCRRCKMEIIK